MTISGGWNHRKLKSIASLITTKAVGSGQKIGLENIESWTGRFINTNGDFEGDGVSFEAGDVLFGKLRPYLAKAWVADFHGAAVGDFLVIRPNKSVDPKFMVNLLLSPERIDEISSSVYGSKMPRVSWDFVRELEVLLPDRDQQIGIVRFLDRETAEIDAFIADQEELIGLLTERRAATISHAVTKGLDPDAPVRNTGQAWPAAVPTRWGSTSIRHAFSVLDCKHITAEFVDEGGFALASIREIKSTFVELTNAKRTSAEYFELLIEGTREPKAGDLLIGRNASVGEVSIVPEGSDRFAMGQDVSLIRDAVGRNRTRFLAYVLQSRLGVDAIATASVGSTFKRINVDDIKSIIVWLPPTDQECNDISDNLDGELADVDAAIADAREAIALSRERRVALISAAVTGKIDVRGLA